MIKIKTIGPGSDAGQHSMGDKYMVRIGDKSARALCGMYPMPNMGHEIIVAIAPDKQFPSFKNRLLVQNISGQYFLASNSVEVTAWPDVFKIEVTA